MDDAILEKIRKVQGYLKSDNANEAAVAAAKLSELLIKHNLELKDIPTEDRAKADPFANWASDTDTKRLDAWRITLAGAIARANLCKIVIDHSHLQWLGRESNLQVAQYIYQTCADDLKRICDAFWLAISTLVDPEINAKTWKADFMFGAANGVKEKLQAERAKMEVEDQNVSALIVVNSVELQRYTRSQYPYLGSAKRGYSAGGNAYGLGVTTGKNVSFKTGVGAGGSSAQRRIGG